MSISQWPCIPDHLSDFMSEDMIRFVIAGTSEEYDMPLSIVEPDGKRYDAYDSTQKYRSFCKSARFDEEDGRPVFRGFDKACRDWDEFVAKQYIDSTVKSELNRPYAAPCWIGLQDYAIVEEIGGYRYVAVTGQYIQDLENNSGLGIVEQEVDRWAQKSRFLDEAKLRELKTKLRGHRIASKAAEANSLLCAQQIRNIFNEYWQKHIESVQDSIIKGLDNTFEQVRTNGRGPDWAALDVALEGLRQQLGCQYIAVFATDTRTSSHSQIGPQNVLMLYSSAGYPEKNRWAPPHFKWRRVSSQQDGLMFFDPSGKDLAWKRYLRSDNVPEPPPPSVIRALGDDASGMRCVVVLGEIKGLAEIKGAEEFLFGLVDRLCERIQHLMVVASLEYSEGALREERDFLVHQVNRRLATFQDYQKAVDGTLGDTPEYKRLKQNREIFVQAIGDLVEYTQLIQTGSVVLYNPTAIKRSSTNVIPVLEIAVDEMSLRAEKEQIDIFRLFDRNFPPPPVGVDAFWLKTIFLYLLDNAIKYSRSPRTGENRWIKVHAGIENANLVIEVENFGLGILPENIERIFAKGIRIVEGTRFEIQPGMGRGLYEARGIAHAMGAEVKAMSRHHTGRSVTPLNINECITTFQIIIPLARRQT